MAKLNRGIVVYENSDVFWRDIYDFSDRVIIRIILITGYLGVDWFVVASAIFDRPDRRAAIEELRERLG